MSRPTVTVDRARPVTRTRSERVTASWLAISRARVLATDSTLTRADTVGTSRRRLGLAGRSVMPSTYPGDLEILTASVAPC